jgi:hypothetical protein
MREDALQVVLANGVEDAAATALLDNPHCRFCRIVERDREAAALGDLRQVLAGQLRIELAGRYRDVSRIATAPFG